MQYSIKPHLIFSFLLIITLAACGGGSGGGGAAGPGGPGTDTTAPTAVIQFPPRNSIIETDTVIVRGTANDDGTIASVRVNGVDASSADGFATWSATVPLLAGANALTVEVSDVASNSNAAADSVFVQKQALFGLPDNIVVDNSNNRLLVVDRWFARIIAVDLASGARTVFSDASRPDSSNPFVEPEGIILDIVNNRILVSDFSLDAIFSVDLTTGARSIFSGATTPNTFQPFNEPSAMALDTSNNRLLVVNSGNSVIEVVLSGAGAGSRSVMSSNTRPNATNAFTRGRGITVDPNPANNRAFVVDSVLDAVLAINMTTGARTVFSNNTTPNTSNRFWTPLRVVADSDNNRLLVGDSTGGTVMAVGLSSGARTVVSNLFTPDELNNIGSIRGIAMSASPDLLFAADAGRRGIVRVSTTTGVRSVLTEDKMPLISDVGFIDPTGVVLDRVNGQAFISDRSPPGAIWRINLNSGARSVLSNDSIPDSVNPFVAPEGLALSDDGSRLWVVDSGLDALLWVDVATGTRTVHATGLADPESVVLDAAGNRALIVNNLSDSVVAIDLTSGIETVISDVSRPVAGADMFVDPTALVLDSATNRVLVADAFLNAIIEVSLADGERRIISDSATPDSSNPLQYPSDLVLDRANNRLLVVDAVLDDVWAVDLSTGARTIVANGLLNESAINFRAGGIALDARLNQAIVVDGRIRALMAIDLYNGQRAVQSAGFYETTP